MATDAEGKTVTDPTEVLRVWREFSANIASADLQGTKEEGIYDEDYHDRVEARLAWLRRVKCTQPDLDSAITAKEVFKALRKLKMGTAGGEDGIVSDIIKAAADAVGTNKMRGNTGVVEALVLIFNYVFDNEVWPKQ